MRLIALFLTTYGLLFATSSLAFASESALTAAPAILESVLNLNSPVVVEINIQNNTNFPLPVKGSASAFLATEAVATEASKRYNASSWFSLDPADFILQPKEVKPIKVTITAPKDSIPGGHYATLFFRPLVPESVLSTASAVSLARIGVLALTIIPGDITENLTTNALNAPSFQAFGPVKYWHSLTNTGSIHLLPKSTLTVTNLWGKTVATIDSSPSLILPQTTKDNNLVWDTTWGFGPYTATLSTTYGTNQPQIVSNPVVTYLLPWPILLTLFLLLTIIYKIFIVNHSRLVLALRVLRGQYEPSSITQKISRQRSRSGSGTIPPHSLKSARQSPRRQSHRRQDQSF